MLTFTHVSFVSQQIEHDFQSPDFLKITLQPSTINLQEVIISDTDPKDNLESAIAGATRLSLKNIEHLPAFLGETDVIKSITLLPGVSTVGEGSSGFNVRGGSIDQNLVTIDGMQLFNTSHVLGFFSIFHPDATKDFILYKGHVPARYGGRASSVLAVNSLQGNKNNWSAEGAVGTFSGKLTVQGPVTKTLSVIAAGRLTYSDWILHRIKDLDIQSSAANFYDVFLRADNYFNAKHHLMLSVLNSRDRFDFADEFGFEWENKAVNMKYDFQINPVLKLDLGANYLSYNNILKEFQTGLSSQLENAIDKTQFNANLNWALQRHTIDAGYEYLLYDPAPEIYSPLDQDSKVSTQRVQLDRGREMAIYLQDAFIVNSKIEINGGIRINFFAHLGPHTQYHYMDEIRSDDNISDTVTYSKNTVITKYVNPAPRIAVRYKLSPGSSIKVSYNRLYQYLHLISNTTSATPVDQWQVSTSYITPTAADNYSLGLYKNFSKNTWVTSVEGFYKRQENVIEYKDFAELLAQENIEAELLRGRGKAYGIELFIKHITPKWNSWLTYVYTRSLISVTDNGEQINRGEWFPTYYDQPHTFKFVSDLKIGRQSSFGASAVYNTGRPITGLEANYKLGQLVVPHYSDRNKYRIPNYFRMDLSLTIGSILNKVEDKLVISVYNLLGRRNAYSVYYQKPDDFSIPQAYKLSVLGSIFPSLTYSMTLP